MLCTILTGRIGRESVIYNVEKLQKIKKVLYNVIWRRN